MRNVDNNAKHNKMLHLTNNNICGELLRYGQSHLTHIKVRHY